MGPDFEILLLRRNQKISYGGYFAFPGGMIEKQDYRWEDEENVKTFDFVKRIAALRELFEECGILLANN